MNTDFVKDLSDKAKESIEPIGKFNELLTSSIQETFKFQMESAKKYSDLASEQFKALTEVRDVESMQEFVKGQMETVSKFNEQMMNDVQALTEAGHKFREEFEAIVNPKAPEKSSAGKAATKSKAS